MARVHSHRSEENVHGGEGRRIARTHNRMVAQRPHLRVAAKSGKNLAQPELRLSFIARVSYIFTLGKKISRRNARGSFSRYRRFPRPSHRASTAFHPSTLSTSSAPLPLVLLLLTPRAPWYPLPPYLLFRFFLRTQWSPNPSRTTLPPSRLRYPSFSSYLGGTASRNNSIFLCEYNFAFNLFSPLFPSLACSPAKIPTAVDRLSLPPSLPPASRALRLVLLFPISLALLLYVSLRFFRSEPSSPPLTSVYAARSPPTFSFSLLVSRRRLRALSPPSLDSFVQPRCRPFLSS